MLSLRNIDLKTAHYFVSQTSKSSKENGLRMGLVPAGMTRWVTFLMLDSSKPLGATQLRLYIASLASNTSFPKASIFTTTHRKMMLDLRGTKIVATFAHCAPYGLPPLMIPPVPDPEKPLFSIAGGKKIGFYSSGTIANVFVQYFDE